MNHPTTAQSPISPTHVVISDTPYYTTGPQQGRPPEGTLKAGTKVSLLQDGSSYVVVQAIDGPTGHVAATALQPIAP